MLAPERSSARVTACFSASVKPVRRRDPVGRCAARHQHQHEIVGAGAVGELRARLGRRKPGCVRDRMAGLDHRECAGSAGRSRGAPPRCPLRRSGGNRACRDNAARRLPSSSPPPCRRRARSAGPAAAARQMRREAARRMRGRDRGVEQVSRKARGVGHDRSV